MNCICRYESPVGTLTMVSDGDALSALLFEGQDRFPYLTGTEEVRQSLPVFRDTAVWLDTYFYGGIPDFTPTLRPKGTPFRLAVWELLSAIPYGRTVTYGDIARQIARHRGVGRMSAQAVGGAVGSNPISIIVPCHRVIGADGSLIGYGGGLDRKRFLLELEGIEIKK